MELQASQAHVLPCAKSFRILGAKKIPPPGTVKRGKISDLHTHFAHTAHIAHIANRDNSIDIRDYVICYYRVKNSTISFRLRIVDDLRDFIKAVPLATCERRI